MELPKHNDEHYEIRDCSQNKTLQHQEESKIYGNISLQQIWKTQTQKHRVK